MGVLSEPRIALTAVMGLWFLVWVGCMISDWILRVG